MNAGGNLRYLLYRIFWIYGETVFKSLERCGDVSPESDGTLAEIRFASQSEDEVQGSTWGFLRFEPSTVGKN